MYRRLIVLSLLMITVTGGVFAIRPVEPRDAGNVSSNRSVMIVSEWSRYKENLIESLVEDLDDGRTAIFVRNFSDLPNVTARDHDAIVVINAGVGSEVRSPVVEWLNSQTYDDNIVVLTTQIYDWTPQITVDSVTSASRNGNIPQVSSDLVRRVRSFL